MTTERTPNEQTEDVPAWADMTGDILSRKYAIGDDVTLFDQGCHYDYRSQTWRYGHDHAHFTSQTGDLQFCGADLHTCGGIDQDYEPTR
jgi:hypothetical protein